MTEEPKKRLRDRILSSVLLLCGGILIAAVWWYYTRERDALQSSISMELAAIADVKAKQIANWRSERIGDGGVLSSALVIGRARSVLSKGAAADRVALQDVLQRFIAGFHYAGAAVVDRNGDSHLQVQRTGDDRERYRLVEMAAFEAGGVFLSDLYLDRSSGQPWMLLVVPVPSVGAIILHIDPSTFLYPYLGSWPISSRTGETLLVRREGDRLVYLSEGMTVPSLWRRGPWSMGPLRSDPAKDLFRWTDYRRVPVMGVIQPIPESNWWLVAKIDQAEADAPLASLGWSMAWLIALIAALNVAGASLVWRSRQLRERREAERRLHSANRALAAELEERTRSEQEIQALSARLINAQEEERARLARELHDDLSQQIAAISIATSNLRKRIPLEFSDVLERCGLIQQKLGSLVDGMRRLSHELHPAVLQHSGLAAALGKYCSDLSDLTSHQVAFRSDGPCDFVPPAVALCVYRVAQEALQNSVKHAQVNEADVVLSCRNGAICLRVSDRGVGMRPGAAGLGLVSIRERTRLVNGTVEIKGEPGEGVTLTLQIPMPRPEQPRRAEAGTAVRYPDPATDPPCTSSTDWPQ